MVTCAARDHHIGIIAHDGRGRLAERVSARGARRGDAHVGAAEIKQ